MTKKHFEAFAKRIKTDMAAAAPFPGELERTSLQARYAANLVADIASADNPRFDRERFMTACGL